MMPPSSMPNSSNTLLLLDAVIGAVVEMVTVEV
jgi:hypothetical protein